MSKRYLDCILAVTDAKSAVGMILLLKTYQKCLSCYRLPCSFKILMTVFAFLYVRATVNTGVIKPHFQMSHTSSLATQILQKIFGKKLK